MEATTAIGLESSERGDALGRQFGAFVFGDFFGFYCVIEGLRGEGKSEGRGRGGEGSGGGRGGGEEYPHA